MTDPTNDIVESKSQRRRDALEVLDLAKRLVDLSAGQLAKIRLPDNVTRELTQARKIKARVARKRQIQFLAKHLREADLEPIFDDFVAATEPARAEKARNHRLEAWREHLIANGDPAIQQLCEIQPTADRQQIRQLVLAAVRERRKEQTPKSARQLYQVISALDEANELPQPS